MHHMTTPHLPPLSFTEACACMRFGQMERVHDLLHASTALPWHPREKAYLAAWVSCCEEEWETAATILLAENIAGRDAYLTRTEGATIRRKKPWVLWLLGNLAVSLCCAEAGEHYHRALRLLDERRMNIPWLRIQISTDQAQWLAHSRDCAGARRQYETALALCVGSYAAHEALPGIYAGLFALAQTNAGEQQEALEQALAYGKLALASVTEAQARAELLCQIARVYERLGLTEQALTTYRDALQLTDDRSWLIAIWAALALLSLTDHDGLVAHGYCLLALDEPLEDVPSDTLGQLYLACSRVAHHQQKEEEAVSWATKALAVTPTNAEALGFLAQILEELLERDRQVAQTAFWHEGYQLVTRHLS